MIHAYDKTYLDDVMAGLGAMFDYAVNGCGQDLSLFYARFVVSGVAGQIEIGNPKYLCGLSGMEMAIEVAHRTGLKLPVDIDYMVNLGSKEYWTGWTMAYIQWHLNIRFSVLSSRGVTISELYSRYSTLHEADLTKSVELANETLNRYLERINPLKQARKKSRLTQEEVSVRTGINLRSIRAYEQGQLSLQNAAAQSVSDVCQVIGCKPSFILC